MAKKKYAIAVRSYTPPNTWWGAAFLGRITGNYGFHTHWTTVHRQLRSECIGNFNPVFCTIGGQRRLVQSDKGDLSDPFRAEESYLESLFVVVPPELGAKMLLGRSIKPYNKFCAMVTGQDTLQNQDASKANPERLP